MASDYLNDIEKELLTDSMSPREKCLLYLLLGDAYNSDKALLLFDRLDISSAKQDFLLGLSILGTRVSWNYFPLEIVSRLKGLHRYCQVQNLQIISSGLPVIDVLCAAAIPVMLLKGMAMKAYYAPDIPRRTSDMDIAVPESCFEKAAKVLQEAGYEWNVTTIYHAQTGNNGVTIEIHRWIFKHGGDRNTDIWARAIPVTFFNRHVYVLAPEDMLIHTSYVKIRDESMWESQHRNIQWLYDVCHILKKNGDINWKALRLRSDEFRAGNHVRLSVCMYLDTFPGNIDWDCFNIFFPMDEKYLEWLNVSLKTMQASRYWHSRGKYETSVLKRSFAWIKKEKLLYQYYKAEFLPTGIHNTYIGYFISIKCIHNARDFWNKIVKFLQGKESGKK